MAKNKVPAVKNELVKHSGAIHIHGDLNLTQRKISNILLKNAFNELKDKDRHVINLSKLMKEIGYNSNNVSALKENIDNLVTTRLNWNTLNKDNKNEWIVSTVVASARVSEGIVEYSYSPHLKELLRTPNIYARLNLIIQKKFKSVYSLTLWEFLLEIICSSGRDEITTDWYSISDYKRVMSVKEHEHKQFKMLNLRLVKEPLKELNAVSDIFAEVFYKKEGRRVVALAFNAKRKINYQMDLGILTPEHNEEKIVNDNTILNSLIEEFKIAEKKARSILEKYSEKDILEALKYVRNELQSNNKIKNLAAFTVKSIEEKWIIVEKEPNKEQSFENKIQEIEEKFTNSVWLNVWSNLKEELELPVLISWIAKIIFIDIENNNAYLGAENNFIKEYIESNFTAQLLKAFKKYDSSVNKIIIKLIKK